MSDHILAPRAATADRPADLADLAELLEDSLLPTDGRSHAWLVLLGPPIGDEGRPLVHAAAAADPEVGSEPDETISLVPLDDGVCATPVDVLTGFIAPDGCRALGVVATATARRLDCPEYRRTPVFLVLLVDRSGRAVSRLLRMDGGGPYEPVDGADGLRGMLPDLCRRALGLPTAPPDTPPLLWWAQLWLDALLQQAAEAPGRPVPWTELVAHHPLHDIVDDDIATLGPAGFARAVQTVAARYDWERLRRIGLAGTGREIAAWMDEGCFARWTLGARPDVRDLLAALGSVLPGTAMRSVTAMLDRWGVPV
jgi:hypothetical protein